MKRLLVAVLFCCAAMIQAAPRPTLFDDCFLLGPTFDISERRGYLDFTGATEQVPANPLFSYGGMIGKRWRINPRLRIQLSGELNYGSVIDDTLPPSSFDGILQTTVLEKKFFRGGLVADLQYPLSVQELPVRIYLHAGAGVHVTWFSEHEKALGDQATPIAGDAYLDSNQTMLSASAHCGLGGEWNLSPRAGMSLSYSLRYGYPVHYTSYRDMYPQGVPYSERFISHEIDLVILLRQPALDL